MSASATQGGHYNESLNVNQESRTAHTWVCVNHCAQLLYTTQHRTVLITFPLMLQTIIRCCLVEGNYIQNGHKQKRPRTKTATNQTKTATVKVQNGHIPKRPKQKRPYEKWGENVLSLWTEWNAIRPIRGRLLNTAQIWSWMSNFAKASTRTPPDRALILNRSSAFIASDTVWFTC